MEPDKKRLPYLFRFLFAGFILLCTIFAGCGLLSILTLDPPEHIETSDILDYFIVRIIGNTEPAQLAAFKGVEFYYKFYYPAGPGSVPDSAINIRNFDDLLANGFKRLSSASDREGSVSKPFLYIEDPNDRGKTFIATLDFADLENANISVIPLFSEGASVLEMRRGVVDSVTKEYKAFDDFALTDADISSLGLSGSPPFTEDVNLVMYALSFGIEDFSTNIYSKSVYLLRIEIEIDILE